MGALRRPRGRVLVVDDDPVICDLLATALAEHCYLTRPASDAREAICLIQCETPDVVLLDVHLPDISGYALCRRLRDDYGDAVGIILISGQRKESMDRVAGMLLGADDYMVKPFVLDELLARVQRLAQRARPLPRTVVAGLTRRELEILRLLACGLDHTEIAQVLDEEDLLPADEHRLLRALGLTPAFDQLSPALIRRREIKDVRKDKPVAALFLEPSEISRAVRKEDRLVEIAVDDVGRAR